jgi:hypothetical protein
MYRLCKGDRRGNETIWPCSLLPGANAASVADRCGECDRRTGRTLRRDIRRRQILTVFYLRNSVVLIPARRCKLPTTRTDRPMSSENDERSPARCDLPEADIRAELERVLGSAVFRRLDAADVVGEQSVLNREPLCFASS